MDIRAILQSLLRICDGSDDYFVSGSLSFLPLIGYYRAPGHDVDVAMSDTLFRRRFAAICHEGTVDVLRLGQVAVTDRALVSRLLSPKTAFVHVETPGGLLRLGPLSKRLVESRLLSWARPIGVPALSCS